MVHGLQLELPVSYSKLCFLLYFIYRGHAGGCPYDVYQHVHTYLLSRCHFLWKEEWNSSEIPGECQRAVVLWDVIIFLRKVVDHFKTFQWTKNWEVSGLPQSGERIGYLMSPLSSVAVILCQVKGIRTFWRLTLFQDCLIIVKSPEKKASWKRNGEKASLEKRQLLAPSPHSKIPERRSASVMQQQDNEEDNE